jgi:hypothetical protein
METTDQLLEDFLVFLDKEGLLDEHALSVSEEIIDKYWEGFQ